MTDSKTCHVDTLPRIKAAGQSCSECPFRKSNIDRPHFNDQYSQTEFTRLWRSIAVEGKFFGCHLTDADYHPVPQESLDMGYQKPADIGARRECAGSVALIRREMRLAESYPNHATYIKARPAGLSKHAFLVLSKRLKGMMEPPVRFAVKPDESDVIDPMERIDTTSFEWAVNTEGAAAILLAIESVIGSLCECPVCTNHTTAHKARPFLTAEGMAVDADEELHGLLSSMSAAGIQTMDSCINMADALEKLWPERTATLVRAPIGKMNYSSMIRSRAAHIRYSNGPAADAFTRAASAFSGVEVSSSGPVTQIVFQPKHIPALTAAAKR
ncbi:hypothetical protein [Arthrobacter sp. FB24]|uniref:hypothetical protein n=1 Tax=Arthrobacter sp. (strain FB24) TaxID=290399 RepID=UPI00031F29A3|nr:hypothetical protein [Arthrobacter sp. FB24]